MIEHQLKFFAPLTFTRDSDDDEIDPPHWKLLEIIEELECDKEVLAFACAPSLADSLHEGDTSKGNVIREITTHVSARGKKLYVCFTVTADEMANFYQFTQEVVDYLDGQISDGWGENFFPDVEIDREDHTVRVRHIEFVEIPGIAFDTKGKYRDCVRYIVNDTNCEIDDPYEGKLKDLGFLYGDHDTNNILGEMQTVWKAASEDSKYAEDAFDRVLERFNSPFRHYETVTPDFIRAMVRFMKPKGSERYPIDDKKRKLLDKYEEKFIKRVK